MTMGAFLLSMLETQLSWATATERIHSVFHIEKSENRNEVHYDVRVDEHCRPLRKDPIVPYWRDLEVGDHVIAPLTSIERRAYGIADNIKVTHNIAGGTVTFALRPLRRRRLVVRTMVKSGHCKADAWTMISGAPAQLHSVFVKVGFLSADYIILRGALASGQAVRERLEP